MKTSFQRTGKWIIAIFGIILFITTACQSTREQASTLPEPMINQEILSEEGEPILVGKITRKGLSGEAYSYWLEDEYQNYEVNTEVLNSLQETINSVDILVFLGTWCSDSQRELPRFYKIMDYLKVPENKYNVIALDNHTDRYKKSPQHEEEGWDIEYVPTFIVLKDGKELGRIVEAPYESMEQDLASILKEAEIIH